MYALVQSESSDYYVIPEDKIDVWYDKWCFKENLPKWATYVELYSFRFNDWV